MKTYKKLILIIWVLLFILNTFYSINIEYYIWMLFNEPKIISFYELFFYLIINSIRFLFSILSFLFFIFLAIKK